MIEREQIKALSVQRQWNEENGSLHLYELFLLKLTMKDFIFIFSLKFTCVSHLPIPHIHLICMHPYQCNFYWPITKVSAAFIFLLPWSLFIWNQDQTIRTHKTRRPRHICLCMGVYWYTNGIYTGYVKMKIVNTLLKHKLQKHLVLNLDPDRL